MIKRDWNKYLFAFLSLVLFTLSCPAAGGPETVPLTAGWTFAPGDNLDYATPGFDDSGWAAIRVDRIWEAQGYPKLDGFAWFRLRFRLPSSLRTPGSLPDGVRFYLGKINNFDQTFLNGALIGVNGAAVDAVHPAPAAPEDGFTKADTGLWNVARCYVLPPDDPRLRWDAENVLAVRVFDAGGEGGLWTGDAHARMAARRDYLRLDPAGRSFEFAKGRLAKSFPVSNSSAGRSLDGTLRILGTEDLSGRAVLERAVRLDLPPGASRELSVELPEPGQGVTIRYTFDFAGEEEPFTVAETAPYILTPPPPAAPRINGPAVIGAGPGRPFLFAIPATGRRPIRFGAKNLPPGLSLDRASGIITGSPARAGEYKVSVTAENSAGRAKRELTLLIGNRLALTPPMGWNSWNCWGLAVDQDKVLDSARVFREKGLQDHGWSFINIDDGWEIKGDDPRPKRDPRGDIVVNEKFPDMKALGDRLHALGLKFGIYSSPGPLTCGGYTGSHGHEPNDARVWAAWGIDYLKYDWCSYEQIARDDSRAELMAPYQAMRAALDAAGRDVVYSLCQYGMGKVWEWGADVGGNLWRTTGDITDTWDSLREIGFGQVENAPFAGPGRWNDPDMLVVGWVGWGPSLHPTRLTPDEQYTHMSLWCLLSAPLLIGCDLTRLDPFTLNLLTNDEVLAVDQDALGRQATPRVRRGDFQVWVKELAGGGRVVGIFNLGAAAAPFTLAADDLTFGRGAKIRDLWRQQDLGRLAGPRTWTVPAHGVVLLRIGG